MTGIVAQEQLTVHAETAADLMVSNVVSIGEHATLHEALKLFTKRGFSAAPVIDSAGRPVGVLSLSDIVIHYRTNIEWGAQSRERSRDDGSAEDYFQESSPPAKADATKVGDLMTPAVFSVSPETSVRQVIREISALEVHRLFVVDEAGVLVGVISALDIVRHLGD